MTDPKVATSDEEIAACFDVIAELRKHLERDAFLPMVRGMQAEGYRLAYVEDRGAIVAAAGYRILTTLFMGKNLYVDDLVTSASRRSKGYGKVLIDWLRDLAVEENCTHLHLDSGTQRDRAHRFYFNQGMEIASFHFSQRLSG